MVIAFRMRSELTQRRTETPIRTATERAICGRLAVDLEVSRQQHRAVHAILLDLLPMAGAAIDAVFAYRREQKAKKTQQADDQKSS
jgi:hypothetical protein